MSPLPTLEGARVLVTGASAGIGAALAPLLAERGATVGIVARRADRLAEVLERCRDRSPGADPGHRLWAVDLSDPDGAAALALEAWDALDGLDGLVNNAGKPMRRNVRALDLATVDDVMRTNYLSPVAMSLAVLPRMLDADRGVIVNVASLAGRVGVPGEAAYSASKFALSGWTECMQLDLWHTAVEMRLVHPGAIATEIWDQPGNDPSPYPGPWEDPVDVAEAICEALTGPGFETYVPDLKPIIEFKTSDIETFMAGAVAFADGEIDVPEA